ncbi:response regulator [Ulvibacterium sp.]|uniref:response regulator n=1 Tax=Ulvibacterium sp. TaxID=2665914 RepID=UPI003BAD9384
MKQNVRILITDNHPMTVKGYALFLENIEMGYRFDIECALSCDDVLDKMKRHKYNFYDLVLLDIGLPPSKDYLIISGEDLGIRIRSKFKATKIFVHTALCDHQRISNIFKSLRPEGFVIKSDLHPAVFKDAINSVLKGQCYYSEQASRLIGDNQRDDLFLDASDRKILYHLSKGERMKDLPGYIPLAMATIERRKKNLKIRFGIPDGNTKQLLDIARAKGFI